MRLDALVDELGFYLAGDPSLEVRAFRYASEAEMTDLAFALNTREAGASKAKAILIPTGILPGKTLIYPKKTGADSHAAALALVARAFVRYGEAPDYEAAPHYRSISAFPGAMIGAKLQLAEGVSIAPFVSIGDNVCIGRNSRIESGAVIGSGVRIGDNVAIASGARVGAPAFFHYRMDGGQHVFCGIGGVALGSGVHVGSNAIIQRGSLSDTVLGEGSAIGHGVIIGHDAHIGANCLIVSMSGISGQVVMEKGSRIFGQAGIAERVHIGAGAVILAQSRISKNVKPHAIISGSYNRPHKEELRLRGFVERFSAKTRKDKHEGE